VGSPPRELPIVLRGSWIWWCMDFPIFK